jgi:hypothetical protein
MLPFLERTPPLPAIARTIVQAMVLAAAMVTRAHASEDTVASTVAYRRVPIRAAITANALVAHVYVMKDSAALLVPNLSATTIAGTTGCAPVGRAIVSDQHIIKIET